MKRVVIGVLLALVMVACVSAQTVYYKNQATLQWDAVTTDAGGNPLVPGDVMSYEVYVYDYNVGVADPQVVGQLTWIGETIGTELLIVFPYRTTWAAGVRAKLVDGASNVTYSVLAWSYIVADADVVSGPFLYSPYGTPAKPLGLRDSGM